MTMRWLDFVYRDWRRSSEPLKQRIRHRLKTEDYTCRLPKIKPRVRHKLLRYIVVGGVTTDIYQ